MKTALVIYSLDGNCAYAADIIKSNLNADLIRIQTKDEKKRGKAARFFWAGGMMFSKRNPPVKEYQFDPSVYDLIIIGVPVWAGSPAAPVKTFLSQTPITGKKTAVFVCHAGGKGKSLDILKSYLKGNIIIGEADFLNPAKNNEEINKNISDWANKLKG